MDGLGGGGVSVSESSFRLMYKRMKSVLGRGPLCVKWWHPLIHEAVLLKKLYYTATEAIKNNA